VWNSRCVLSMPRERARTKGVGMWGLHSCPVPLVVVENPGERRDIPSFPCCGPSLLVRIPPLPALITSQPSSATSDLCPPSLPILLLPFGGDVAWMVAVVGRIGGCDVAAVCVELGCVTWRGIGVVGRVIGR
jgi:hypothetical protein